MGGFQPDQDLEESVYLVFFLLQQIQNFSLVSEEGRRFVKRLSDLKVQSTLFVPDNSGLPVNQVSFNSVIPVCTCEGVLTCVSLQTLTRRDIEFHLSEGRALPVRQLKNGTRIRTHVGSLSVLGVADMLNAAALVRLTVSAPRGRRRRQAAFGEDHTLFSASPLLRHPFISTVVLSWTPTSWLQMGSFTFLRDLWKPRLHTQRSVMSLAVEGCVCHPLTCDWSNRCTWPTGLGSGSGWFCSSRSWLESSLWDIASTPRPPNHSTSTISRSD